MQDATETDKSKAGTSLLECLMPFFASEIVDYNAARQIIETDLAYDKVSYRTAIHSIETLEAFDAGSTPEVGYQLLVAKGVLSFVIGVGRIREARILLGKFEERWGTEKFQELATMLNPRNGMVERMDFVDQPWLEYQVKDRNAATTVMLFCGAGNRFGVPINAFMIWLADMSVNAVYLRDFQKLLYLGGVSAVGNLPETIAKLKSDLREIGTERLICMGNSGGVYGALHYAQLLDADQVLCFAGPTSLEAGNQMRSERPVYEGIAAQIKQGTLHEPDLRALYQNNPIPVRMFFGSDHEFDAVQTKTFEGLSNVSFEPLANWDKHFVIGELARLGLLEGILSSAIMPEV